jgi:cell division protein FtsN
MHLPAGFSLHLGTSAAHMLPAPMTTPSLVQTIGIPASMDRINFTVGLNWMLYEKSYRQDAKARRAAKKVKRAAKKAEKALNKAVQPTADAAVAVAVASVALEVAPIGLEIQDDKNYYVVVGSFLSQELASKRSKAIQDSRIVQSESKYFRVCLGPFQGTEVRQRLEELKMGTPDAWAVEAE